jgi:hypothetical protein
MIKYSKRVKSSSSFRGYLTATIPPPIGANWHTNERQLVLQTV